MSEDKFIAGRLAEAQSEGMFGRQHATTPFNELVKMILNKSLGEDSATNNVRKDIQLNTPDEDKFITGRLAVALSEGTWGRRPARTSVDELTSNLYRRIKHITFESKFTTDEDIEGDLKETFVSNQIKELTNEEDTPLYCMWKENLKKEASAWKVD